MTFHDISLPVECSRTVPRSTRGTFVELYFLYSDMYVRLVSSDHLRPNLRRRTVYNVCDCTSCDNYINVPVCEYVINSEFSLTLNSSIKLTCKEGIFTKKKAHITR